MAAGASLLMGGFSLLNAQTQAANDRMMGEYQKQQGFFNARIAEMQAEETQQAGRDAAARREAQGIRDAGTQRAIVAASGRSVDSMEGLYQETLFNSQMDAMEIRNSAWRQAWGLEVEADQSRFNANMNNLSAHTRSRNTLLTGGLNAISYGTQAYRDWNK